MLAWLPRAVTRFRSEASGKVAFVRAGISSRRGMAFSVEERGSQNEFDYRIFFSKFLLIASSMSGHVSLHTKLSNLPYNKLRD